MNYTVKIFWKKILSEPFVDSRYSRAHTWSFDGGIEIAASASPHVVPLPYSKENAVDPEEAFVASISSCHMLWFLSLAAAKKFVIESYEDRAEGILAKNERGDLAMTEVTLKPKVIFGGMNFPSAAEIDTLHHSAHEKCYIASSIKTKITIIPS